MQKRWLGGMLPFFLAMTFLVASCGPKDADIQKSIDTAVKADADLSGLAVTVKDGVATISGESKDDASKAKVESLVKGIKGVKNVINNATVAAPPPPPPAPVEVTADDPLAKALTDATKDFPGVKASVKDGVITLSGEISKANLRKLMMVLNTLKPKQILQSELTIK